MENITLNFIDFIALSPLLILLFTALLLIIIESFAENQAKKILGWVAFIGIISALGAAITAPASQNPLLTPWLQFDALGRLFSVIFLSIGLSTILLSMPFFKSFEASQGEYYFLLVSALFGLVLIGSAADFLTIFLGLETLSISLYILCGYMKKWKISGEASMKYFLMGALAAAILVYGIALIYGAIGTTRLDALLNGYHSLTVIQNKMLFMAGIALVTLGFAFKAAVVPFHIWAPDVYAGAPTPVTAFMAVGTKVGAFAAFARVFLVALPQFNPIWNESIALLAYPTLIYANYVALRQVQLRRFFAYSGISQAGFLLIPLAAGTAEALPSLLFYLTVYSLATMACFAVLTFLDQEVDGVMMHHLHGLFHRSPILASVFSLGLLTLAGIPPTAGFFAKFYIFKIAFEAGYHALVIVALLTTILSAYYYLKIISLMLTKEPGIEIPLKTRTAGWVGAITFTALLILSIYPAPLFNLIHGNSQ